MPAPWQIVPREVWVEHVVPFMGHRGQYGGLVGIVEGSVPTAPVCRDVPVPTTEPQCHVEEIALWSWRKVVHGIPMARRPRSCWGCGGVFPARMYVRAVTRFRHLYGPRVYACGRCRAWSSRAPELRLLTIAQAADEIGPHTMQKIRRHLKTARWGHRAKLLRASDLMHFHRRLTDMWPRTKRLRATTLARPYS
ncbi:MAG: hypothetical protein CL902_00745 [Dehalococcoidia bacterium]|nr:hypothetical protein [Dehalococcoidia bacterium]